MKYYYRCMIKPGVLTRPKKVIHRTGSNTFGLCSLCCLQLTSSGLPAYYTSKKLLHDFIKANEVLEICTKQIWEF